MDLLADVRRGAQAEVMLKEVRAEPEGPEPGRRNEQKTSVLNPSNWRKLTSLEAREKELQKMLKEEALFRIERKWEV